MKYLFPLVAVLNAASATEPALTTVSTSMLRGSKVTKRRTVFPLHTEEGMKPENRNNPDQLVDTPQHNQDEERLRGDHSTNISQEHLAHHHGHRNDGYVRGHATHDQHFEKHDAVEHIQHHHHMRPHDQEAEQDQQEQQLPPPHQAKAKNQKKKVHHDKSMYTLPTGLAEHFNETLFDELHYAPFDIYERTVGHEFNEGDSFPVFSVPSWHTTPGVFSGFNKQGEPVVFENKQFLLKWADIEGASTVRDQFLNEFIADNNFHTNLIIGQAFKDASHNVPFLGLVVSYYQYGSKKNVLVPFGKLEDFFDDASEQHLSDPETKHLEAEALHEMLDQKRTNSSDFYHPTLAHSQERKEQLEDLEIIHFQKLFQLLIRRSFLFSYGYADCLMQEPESLRECLDDTYYSLVRMETSVRGALEEQIIEQLEEINETSNSHVKEACISFEGGIIGTGGCTDTNDLTAFVTSFASF